MDIRIINTEGEIEVYPLFDANANGVVNAEINNNTYHLRKCATFDGNLKATNDDGTISFQRTKTCPTCNTCDGCYLCDGVGDQCTSFVGACEEC